MHFSLKSNHNWFNQNCHMDEKYGCMFGMTVLILILPQFLKLSYNLRTHRNEINRAISLSLYQQSIILIPSLQLLLYKEATILDISLPAAVMNSTTAHTKEKK
jgi:hypothetical protein